MDQRMSTWMVGVAQHQDKNYHKSMSVITDFPWHLTLPNYPGHWYLT